jgi:hypothetical protein
VLDWYANWVKDYAILAWGFTFRDAEHMQKFLDSPTYAAMAGEAAQGTGPAHPRAAPTQPRILFSKKPVGSLNDLNGVKMRVPEIKTYLTLWETLGTRPSRLAWGEIYLGLKTGVVEAAEGPISSAYSAKFHEAAPNVIRTDHLMSSAHITINEKAFTSLPADMQKLVTDCAVEAVQNTRKTAQAETETSCARWPQKGRKVTAHRQGADPGAARTAWPRWRRTGRGRTASGNRSRSSSRMLSRCKRLIDGIGRVERGLGIALILYMVAAITVQVFTRYALGRPIAWVEESATYAFIWMSFVGASVGLKQGRHIRHRHLRRAFAATRGGRPSGAGLGAGAADAGGPGGAGLEGDGRRRPLVDDLAADRAAAQLVLFAALVAFCGVDDPHRVVPAAAGAVGGRRPGAGCGPGPHGHRDRGGAAMSLWVLFGLFALLVILEVPVAFAMGLASIATIVFTQPIPLSIVVQRMGTGLDSFVLIAIPLFVLAGHLLNRAGIADRIFEFAAPWLVTSAVG